MKKWLGEGVGWQTARKSFETDGVISSRAEGGLNMMVHEGERGRRKKKSRKRRETFFWTQGTAGEHGKIEREESFLIFSPADVFPVLFS